MHTMALSYDSNINKWLFLNFQSTLHVSMLKTELHEKETGQDFPSPGQLTFIITNSPNKL